MLVDAVKFPPLGDRGMDGAGLDANYFLGDAFEYLQDANQETFLVVQIETQQAVENAEAIASIEGVDAMFVGPGDLGMRHRLKCSNVSAEEGMEIVAAASKKHGTAWGCPAFDVEQMKKLHGMGARFLAHGGDFWAIKNMLDENIGHYDEMLEGSS